jgi:hypothetical protein
VCGRWGEGRREDWGAKIVQRWSVPLHQTVFGLLPCRAQELEGIEADSPISGL